MPAASTPSRPALGSHIALALAIAFGLSTAFWLLLGVFVPVGFILWSLISAAIGIAVGAFAVRNIVWTGVVTAVVRVLIYAVMTQT